MQYVHGHGGVQQIVRNVGECKAACISDLTCVAVDWSPADNRGENYCSLLTSLKIVKNVPTPGRNTHHELDRTCINQQGESFFYSLEYSDFV